MTKYISNFIVLFALATALCFGQGTRLTLTTNSTAIATTDTTITLASSTGVTAQGTLGQYTAVGYIDRELVGFQSLVTGTTWKVQRGMNATRPQPHAASSTVFIGPPGGNFVTTPLISEVSGSCTYSNSVTLPLVYTQSGNLYDCLGSKWVRGIRTPTPPFRIVAPDPGAVAYTGINTNGTTLGATTLYCTEVNIPVSKTITGIALLNGTTATTDAQYVILYDAGGRALANSALAGATEANASVYQERSFTTPFYAVGPAQYFGCMQTAGTTGTIRMAVTGTNDNFLTKGQTGVAFGTISALTVPTSFTTAVGPYIYLF